MNIALLHIKKHRAVYSYLLALVLFASFGVYLIRHKESLSALSAVSFKYIIGITILGIIYKLVLGLKFKVMINFFGIKVKPREWFGLSCVVSMVNSLFPAHAGTATQAVYLKQVYKFDYSKFVSYLLNFLVFSVAIYSACGLILLLLHDLFYRVFYIVLFTFFSLLFIACLAFIFLMPRFSRLKFKWDLLNRVIDGFGAFKTKRSLVIRFIVIQAADLVITGLRLFLAYNALGAKVGLIPILLVGLIASLSSIFNLTPANLGIRELFIAVSSALVGEGAALGIMAGVIDRIIGTSITFIFGFISMHILLPSAKITFNEEKAAL